MKRPVQIFLALIFCSGIFVAESFAQTNPPPWISLFDGKDLQGWSIKGGSGKAWVQDGEIICHQVTNTLEHTFVCTDAKFGDFILEADCKIDGDFNSGILFRAVDMPDVKPSSAKLNGYQMKISGLERFHKKHSVLGVQKEAEEVGG